MKPYDLLKWAVLNKHAEFKGKPEPVVTAENLPELWGAFREEDDNDSINEVRCSGEESELPCEWSRHYESKAVAAQMPDGQWVGWTYWYGGGKHGEPAEMDWMGSAYFVTFKEEARVVKVFSMVEPAA